MIKQSSSMTILTLAYANSVGFSGTTSMALWITVVATILPVPTWWGSVIGAAQLAASALGNVGAPFLFRQLSFEKLAVYSVLSAASGYAAMGLTTDPAIYAIAAVIAGLSLGVLLNCCNALLARTESVQSSYASAQICEVAFAGGFFIVGGRIIAEAGLQGIFGLLVAMCFIAAFFMHKLSRVQATPRHSHVVSSDKKMQQRAPVAIAAFILFFVGQSAFFQHQVAIGKLIGLDAPSMGVLMAVAMTGGLLGAFGGKVLGVRRGLTGPTLCATLLLALSLFLVVRTQSQLIFTLCAITIQAVTMFTVPYAFAILAAMDHSRRLPSFGPALLLLGVAGGPLLSEYFLGIGGYGLVGTVAAATVTFAALLFVATHAKVGDLAPEAMST